MKGLQAIVSFLGAVGFASGSAFMEGTEHKARYLGESDGFELFVEWRECGGPENLCSAIEECVDGECVCPEGHVNDGFRGCIDLDECATDYPCPGVEGVSSFCVDRDPINDYYKCGCLPGYDAVYPSFWNSDIPIEFRPLDCEGGELSSVNTETLEIEGIVPGTDPDVLAEQIKADILASLGMRRRLEEEIDGLEYTSELQHLDVSAVLEGLKYLVTTKSIYIIVAIRFGVKLSTEELLALIEESKSGGDSSVDLAALENVQKEQAASAESTAAAASSSVAAVAQENAAPGVVVKIVVKTAPPTFAPTAIPSSVPN